MEMLSRGPKSKRHKETDPSIDLALSLIREKALDFGLDKDQVDRNVGPLSACFTLSTMDLSSVEDCLFSQDITSCLGKNLLHTTLTSQVERFLTKPETVCELSTTLRSFLAIFLREAYRRELVVWKLTGDPPKPEEELGQGAMGTVYKGSATFDGNPVALKVKHFRTQTEEFINEAKIRTLARHENVRKTHGVFIGDGGDPALMMDFEEMDLQQFCEALHKNKIPLSPSSYLMMILDIAMGMNYLSLLGVTYRDMDLDSFLVSSNFTIKVSGFGPSEFVSGDTKVAPGPLLQAPETKTTCHANKAYIWSFGIVCWQILHVVFGLKEPESGVEPSLVEIEKASPDVKKSENPHFLSNVVINATCARNACNAVVPDGFDFYQDLVSQCLAYSPTSRPEWQSIISKILDIQKQKGITFARIHPITKAIDFSEADKLYDANKLNDALNIYREFIKDDKSGWALFQCAGICRTLSPDESEQYARDSYPLLLASAKEGSSRAYFALGVIYFRGKGVPRDKQEAVKWTTKSAEGGNVKGQYFLGLMYERGEGVPMDRQEAVKWITKSAEGGYSEAQFNLGVRYDKGEGVSMDKQEAVKWFTKSTERGDAEAQFNLGSMYFQGEEVSMDKQEALKWFTKSAEGGDVIGQYNLGWMYYKGEGVPMDKQEALKWFTESAEGGDAEAQFHLGLMYQDGEGVEMDKHEAVKWYTKSAGGGNVKAQFNLGLMYEDGEGVEMDKQEAVKWYTKSAGGGDVQGQFNLGLMYKKGEGVKMDNQEAVKWLTKSAEGGCARAQFNLGLAYKKGEGVIMDKQEAVKWLTKSAEGGHVMAQYNLGLMYQKGEVVATDKREAVKWFTKSAGGGDVKAQFHLGLMYKKGEGVIMDKQEAVKWLTKSAEGGYALAQLNLGWMYYDGEGVKMDKQEAVKWFTESAERGYARTQFNLGWMYFQGEGVSMDKQEALKWFTKSAEGGYVKAQFHLGWMYYKGEGVPMDKQEAVKWYTKSAEGGDVRGQFNLGLMYKKGEGVIMDKQEALKWLTKSAEGGDARAQFHLGLMYYDGEGVSMDKQEALKWFTESAEGGDVQGQFNLGLMYYDGEGVSMDKQEALKWFTTSAEGGDAWAQFHLGWMYYDGEGVPMDKQEAVKWFTKSAEGGDVQGQFILGWMYEEGEGVEMDKQEAVKRFTKSAEGGCAEAQLALRWISEPSQPNKLLCFWRGLVANEKDFERQMKTLNGQQTLQSELWKLHKHPYSLSNFRDVLTLINKQPDDLRSKLLELYRSVPLPMEVEDSCSAAPAVVVLGKTQSGKTTLVNSIRKYSGYDGPDLLVGEGNLSTTTKTTVTEVSDFILPNYINLPGSLDEFLVEDWKRPPQKLGESISGFKLIDAPGLGDSGGRDPCFILDLAHVIHDAGSLSGVLLVLDSNSPFGKLKEGLDYYLRFLDSLRLPLFVVHTKWDALEKTQQEKEQREENVKEFLCEIAGKEVQSIHFFIDLCGWEDNVMKQPFTEHYEALKSNSLHVLCKRICAHTSYFTREFMIEKPNLFRKLDSEWLEVIKTKIKRMKDILNRLNMEEKVIAKIYTGDMKSLSVAEKFHQMSKERMMLDTDKIIDFNTAELNLKQDEIVCYAPGATSYKVADICDGFKLENFVFTNNSVKAKIVSEDTKASDKWDIVYFRKALIASGPSSTFYQGRIQQLNELMNELSGQMKDLEGKQQMHMPALSALASETEKILKDSQRVSRLCSLLSRPKRSIHEYSAFLSHYEKYETEKGVFDKYPERFAESIFERTQISSPLPSTVVTPKNPISAIFPASPAFDIFNKVTIRGRLLGGPVTVWSAPRAVSVDKGSSALPGLLLLKSERDPDNIYILEVDVTGERSHIAPRMGKLNERGKGFYEESSPRIVGIFPNHISLELLFVVSRKLCDEVSDNNHEHWVREIIPRLEEAGMERSTNDLQKVCNLEYQPFKGNRSTPIDPTQFFYLKIGTRHYINLDEEGRAYWGEKKENTPYFHKVQVTNEETTKGLFFLQVMGPVFQSKFLTTGFMDFRLIVTSEKKVPSFAFVRESNDARLYCSYFWLDRSPVCQRFGTRYLYSSDLNGGNDVAVKEVHFG